MAAIGIDGAVRSVQRVRRQRRGGSSADPVHLADWASAAVSAEADEFASALDHMDIDPPDAATRLRLRASELREYA